MTMLAPPPSLADQQHIVLEDVPWEFYEQLLEVIGDRPIRITYDEGNLEMMAPLGPHERWKSQIGRMIELMCYERDINIAPYGSTTFRLKRRRKGLEPDECYYVQHADEVARIRDLNLKRNPPPDLAIEIDITSRSVEREPVYAGLGIPELWRFDGRRLSILKLMPSRKYRPIKNSIAFPFLKMPEFERYLLQIEQDVTSKSLQQFVDWVKSL